MSRYRGVIPDLHCIQVLQHRGECVHHQDSALRVSDLAGLAWSPGYRILMSSQVIRSYTSFLESAQIFFFFFQMKISTLGFTPVFTLAGRWSQRLMTQSAEEN